MTVDALVTDVSMPSMNGVELAQRIRELRPTSACSSLSGYAEEALRRRDDMSSLGRFLLKPYSLATLSARLREIRARPRS